MMGPREKLAMEMTCLAARLNAMAKHLGQTKATESSLPLFTGGEDITGHVSLSVFVENEFEILMGDSEQCEKLSVSTLTT